RPGTGLGRRVRRPRTSWGWADEPALPVVGDDQAGAFQLCEGVPYGVARHVVQPGQLGLARQRIPRREIAPFDLLLQLAGDHLVPVGGGDGLGARPDQATFGRGRSGSARRLPGLPARGGSCSWRRGTPPTRRPPTAGSSPPGT